MPSIIQAIREELCKIPESRSSDASAFSYRLPDILMAGLAMMFLQDPSLLEFQRRLHERHRKNNLQTIFHVNDIPSDSQFRRILDTVDPQLLLSGIKPCIQKLQKTRLWEEYRVLDGRYAVLFDGFEFFRSSRKG